METFYKTFFSSKVESLDETLLLKRMPRQSKGILGFLSLLREENPTLILNFLSFLIIVK